MQIDHYRIEPQQDGSAVIHGEGGSQWRTERASLTAALVREIVRLQSIGYPVPHVPYYVDPK